MLQTVILYLESLHSCRMRVYKFVELNPFSNITDVFLDDLRYAKSIALCPTKCDETFCNKVKSRSLNKKKRTILFIYYGIIMYGWFTNLNCDGCMLYLY
jgi:hypothetical protein